jgi:hypothetical protein
VQINHIHDTIQITFTTDGTVVAVLEEDLLSETLLGITVTPVGQSSGKLLCRVRHGKAEFLAHKNLPLVLRWAERCKEHLRIPF